HTTIGVFRPTNTMIITQAVSSRCSQRKMMNNGTSTATYGRALVVMNQKTILTLRFSCRGWGEKLSAKAARIPSTREMIVETPTMITVFTNGPQKESSAAEYCFRVGVKKISGGIVSAVPLGLKLVRISQAIGPKMITTDRYSTRFCR